MRGVLCSVVTVATLFAILAQQPGASEEAVPMRAFSLTLRSGSAAQNMEVIQFRRGKEVVFIAFDGGDTNLIQTNQAHAPLDGGKIICSGSRADMPNLLAQVICRWLPPVNAGTAM